MEEGVNIGNVEAIRRYPIKSMAGEKLDQVYFSQSGIVLDRIAGFRHIGKNSSRNSQRHLTARELPEMVRIKPDFSQFENSGLIFIDIPNYGRVSVQEAVKILEKLSGKGPLEFIIDNENRIQDNNQISLVSRQSLLKVEQEIPGVNDGCFRMNLHVNFLGDYDRPFSEDSLVGRYINLGEAVLAIKNLVNRCKMVNINPASGESNEQVLGFISNQRKAKFGIYADVVQPGLVREGDSVFLIN